MWKGNFSYYAYNNTYTTNFTLRLHRLLKCISHPELCIFLRCVHGYTPNTIVRQHSTDDGK